jgi:hypothetical protein
LEARDLRIKKVFIAVFFLTFCSIASAEYTPFAVSVIGTDINDVNIPYLPAPGWFINDPLYVDADKATGAPMGGGINGPNNMSVVSLGGFGGQIVLAFDHDVKDDPANYLGLDAIVFSNAFWLWGDPQAHESEFASIEIMPELNGNDIPGDAPGEKWYLIPGSHLFDNSSYRSKLWSDTNDSYPGPEYWSQFSSVSQYTTSSHELFPYYQTFGTIIFLENPNFGDPENEQFEGYWGYAEYTPTLILGDRNADNIIDESSADSCDIPAELFYTIPDDPFIVDIDPGSGGGDAFDIAWAVDGQTFELANLSSFRYIRLTTCVDAYRGRLGEVSAEIDAVADARPFCDVNGDGNVNMVDFAVFARAYNTQWPQDNFNAAADINVDNTVNNYDLQQFTDSWSRHY